jgi:nickel-dependent lactate racemase
MAVAERIVRPGGIIVMAAACDDGVPADGAFARLLAAAKSTADLLGVSGEPELDRWQAQVLGRVLARAEVHLFAPGLDAGALPSALLTLVPDLDAAVAAACARLGADARVAVMPEGPLTVATVAAVGDGAAQAR